MGVSNGLSIGHVVKVKGERDLKGNQVSPSKVFSEIVDSAGSSNQQVQHIEEIGPGLRESKQAAGTARKERESERVCCAIVLKYVCPRHVLR